MTQIMKQMLPGLLPLFIFIIADEIWGTETGLYIALGFGVIELLITRIKYGFFDRFILFDTLFLVFLSTLSIFSVVALGLVSIVLDNDIFFKLKPALIEFILCLILGVSAFSSKNIMLAMTRRYTRGMNIEVNEEGMIRLKRMTIILLIILTVHAGATLYSAAYMSNEAWAFISGGLFYIIFAILFCGQIIYYKFIIPWRHHENRI